MYTDFEKAFDKIPHKGLICKLQASGLNKELIHHHHHHHHRDICNAPITVKKRTQALHMLH